MLLVMLVNRPDNLLPSAVTATTMTTAISATIRPYSTAVAPSSSRLHRVRAQATRKFIKTSIVIFPGKPRCVAARLPSAAVGWITSTYQPGCPPTRMNLGRHGGGPDRAGRSVIGASPSTAACSGEPLRRQQDDRPGDAGCAAPPARPRR